MKNTLTLLGLFLGVALSGAETVRYESQPGGSKMKLDGTATTGSWSVECAAIGGFIEADTTFPESASARPKVEISIPVRQLKSGKKAMDAVMHDAMKQPSHPKIEFKVLDLKAKGAPGAKADFDATGTLTVAGVTRTNTMPVTIERMDKTKLKVTGATTLKMTDFGIKPPSPDIPGGGLIKTGDDVKITFEWMPEVEKK